MSHSRGAGPQGEFGSFGVSGKSLSNQPSIVPFPGNKTTSSPELLSNYGTVRSERINKSARPWRLMTKLLSTAATSVLCKTTL